MARRMATKVYRLFRNLGVVGYSSKKNIFGIHPLVVSTAYIGLSIGLCYLLRRAVKSWMSDNVFRDILLEFLTTLEMCISFFELIVVTENWGIEAYAIFLFLLVLIWERTWTDASACPYTALEEVIEGQRDYSNAALRVFGQLAGGLVTFSLVQLFWAMELVHTHKGKAFEDCTADLQVPMCMGAFIEALGTCLCRLVGRWLSFTGNKFASLINALCTTVIVVAAFDTTGGYFNPALATSLKLGCEGNTFMEHFVTYWVGAVIGSVAAYYIFNSQKVQDYLEGFKPKTE
ncbi:aquaporin-11 [Harmonia axyridis]|uniref:aquaporin-11 n=1 Tax=Harmonia axyridis TaxID=115357 RepID=UPI001E2785F2|nr:aquaporin-11 [Harmonia axyridis]